MEIEVVERADSRRLGTGQNPRAELRFDIYGTDSEQKARIALLASPDCPPFFDPWGHGNLFIARVFAWVDPVGPLHKSGVVYYGLLPQTDESVFAFDTGGGTAHITQSIETVGVYCAPGEPEPPNLNRVIGVSADGVAGCDIPEPQGEFYEIHYLSDVAVHTEYKTTLEYLSGSVNDRPFKFHARGECLFLGAAGQKRGLGDWEIMFRFVTKPNAIAAVGDITGIAKEGWHHLWVNYKTAVLGEPGGAQWLIQVPRWAFVEQVIRYEDFSDLRIGV